ncbi:MAG: hypothetical protein RDV48_06100 [Candidatus Eremiobacteraeota bacterium]|nr:hypothetical protein [Candidatus Eremiobacteraeota bacterium]
MAAKDRLSELMESVQKITDRKNDSASSLSNVSLKPSRELVRGNAPSAGSIGQRGDDGGSAGSFMNMDSPEKKTKIEMVSNTGDGYDGVTRSRRVDGIYDYAMMLQLFANPQVA